MDNVAPELISSSSSSCDDDVAALEPKWTSDLFKMERKSRTHRGCPEERQARTTRRSGENKDFFPAASVL